MAKNIRGQLKALEKARVCDEDTVAALAIPDPFVEGVITDTYRYFKQEAPELSEPNELKELRHSCGNKLLFLESLFQAPPELQQQVKEWLQDPKRDYLFRKSEWGWLYGELLLAEAENRLEEYRRTYNPFVAPQTPFIHARTLNVSYHVDEEVIAERKKFPEQKLDAVLHTIQEQYIGEDRELLQRISDTSALERLLATSELEYDEELGVAYELPDTFEELLQRMFSEHNMLTEEEFQRMTSEHTTNQMNYRGEKKLFQRHAQLARGYVQIMQKRFTQWERTAQKKMDALKKVILSPHISHPDEISLLDNATFCDADEFFQIHPAEERELSVLYQENAAINLLQEDIKRRSSKVKQARELIYFFELSEKHPLDVRFGNDGGCCIGVYESLRRIGSGGCVPQYIADNATFIFNIHQQTLQSKKRRTGMILAFAAEDVQHNKVLPCNSIELSAAMNPLAGIEGIVELAEEGITTFGRMRGFKAAFMSRHAYNTSFNFSRRKNQLPAHAEHLRKLRHPAEPWFYSEIVVYDYPKSVRRVGIPIEKERFYVIYDDR